MQKRQVRNEDCCAGEAGYSRSRPIVRFCAEPGVVNVPPREYTGALPAGRSTLTTPGPAGKALHYGPERGRMRDGLFRATRKRLTLTITIIPYVYLTWLCLRHNFPSALQLQAANKLHVSVATMLSGKQSASPLPTLPRCSEFPSHTFIACTGPAGSDRFRFAWEEQCGGRAKNWLNGSIRAAHPDVDGRRCALRAIEPSCISKWRCVAATKS